MGSECHTYLPPHVLSPLVFVNGSTVYQGGRVGAISQQLYTALTELQMGNDPDPLGWTAEVL